MSEPEFFQTRMGQKLYERTLPDLVRQLERLNEMLARIAEAAERQGQASRPTGGEQAGAGKLPSP